MTNESTGAPEFTDFDLSEKVLKALEDVGYTTPTPIQAQTIPVILEGHDLLGQAQTGTGKTAAFALPLLSRLDLKQRMPQVLVLTPTRELALQVTESFGRYGSHMKKLAVLAVYGGQDYRLQLKPLKLGVHVVVGTPGRVMDHIRRGKLDLSQLRCVVLDEADEMLRMGFIDDVEWILGHVPDEGQMALFSATLPEPIRDIARRHLIDPEEITIEKQTVVVEAITQRYWMVREELKLEVLSRLLEIEKVDGMIVFAKTRDTTVELARSLKKRGYECEALNGDILQENREKIVQRFRQGKFDILVATDVAARGLDVDRISHVINYDMPFDSEAYIHRIGRTGRAGRAGQAISLVTPKQRNLLAMVERATSQKIEKMNLPSMAEVNEHRIVRFKNRISHTLETEDLTLFKDLVQQVQNERDLDPVDIAAALAHLAQGKTPLLLTQELPESNPKKDRKEKQGKKDKQTLGPQEHIKQRRLPAGMERYRVEVGRKHQVRITDLIKVVSREAGMDAEFIGQIDLYDDFSLVDMPEGMPREIFKALKKAQVAGQALRITKMPQGKGGFKPHKKGGPRKKR